MANNHVSESTLFRKLLAFQKNAPAIHKNAAAAISGRQYRYADLAAVLDATRPALAACGLVLTQAVDGQNLVTRLADAETGETLESAFPLDFHGLTWHAIGSAISYARRYAILSLLGLAPDEDDDGHAAQAEPRQTNGHRRPEPPQEPAPSWALCETCGDRMRAFKNGGIYCHTCWARQIGRNTTNGHAMKG